MDEAPTYYLDACVFMSLFDPDKLDRHPAIKQVIDNARAGKCRITTSIITITEVAYGANEKSDGNLDQQVLDDINAYWHPQSPVKLVEVGQLLTYSARDLQREALSKGIGRAGSIDAIHVATAKDEKASKLLTYDNKIKRYSSLVPFDITEPVLEAEPDKTPDLFSDENRQ